MNTREQLCVQACEGIPDEILSEFSLDNIVFRFLDAVDLLESVSEVQCDCMELHDEWIECQGCEIRNLYAKLRPLADKVLSFQMQEENASGDSQGEI
jgi:hypothetical protein